jgi:hypothetical protein
VKLLLLVAALAATGCAHRPEVRTACSYIPGQDPAATAIFDEHWGPEMRTRPGYLVAVEKEKAGDCSAIYRYLRGVTIDSERALYGDNYERIKLERYIRAHLPADFYDY